VLTAYLVVAALVTSVVAALMWCTLGLNAEKIDLSAGAGAGDNRPEIGAPTVTGPLFRTVL